MNRCVRVVPASSDLPQKYWSKTYGRTKDHVRKNRRQTHPQTGRPRKAVVSLQIIAIRSNGPKVILVICPRGIFKRSTKDVRGRPGRLAIDCANVPARSYAPDRDRPGSTGPAWPGASPNR